MKSISRVIIILAAAVLVTAVVWRINRAYEDARVYHGMFV
jgi:hypothetical protein